MVACTEVVEEINYQQIGAGKIEERRKDAAEFEFRWSDNISISLIEIVNFYLLF